MWTSRMENLPGHSGLKFFINHNGEPASYADVIMAWQNEQDFRTLFNSLLANTQYAAFRWETPLVTIDTQNRAFEFVVLNDPGLARPVDIYTFSEHFNKSSGRDILAFPNLGRDAILIVPQITGDAAAYGHLGAFVRQAPKNQQQELWRVVGEAMSRRIGAKPVWLNTAGDGVAWLHIRLDDRPKYYAFAPYRHWD